MHASIKNACISLNALAAAAVLTSATPNGAGCSVRVNGRKWKDDGSGISSVQRPSRMFFFSKQRQKSVCSFPKSMVSSESSQVALWYRPAFQARYSRLHRIGHGSDEFLTDRMRIWGVFDQFYGNRKKGPKNNKISQSSFITWLLIYVRIFVLKLKM